MDVIDRFTTLVQGPEPAMPLDEAALLVGANAEPGVDVSRWLGALDDVAARCDDRSFDGLARHMVREGFTGNRDEYYDPRNSYLHEVLDRRVGIPITLCVVMIELGRRIDVPVVGVGLPGHFVVRHGPDTDVFADPFGGSTLDREGCLRLFEMAQSDLVFDDSFLAPVGGRAIVARLLANLKAIHLARRDRRALAAVLRLRVAIPGVPLDERRELASALAADGRFLEAAGELDRLADLGRSLGDGTVVEDAERGATRLRARLN